MRLIKKALLIGVLVSGIGSGVLNISGGFKGCQVKERKENIIAEYRNELLVEESDKAKIAKIKAMDDEEIYEDAKQNGDIGTKDAICQIEIDEETAKNLKVAGSLAHVAVLGSMVGYIAVKNKDEERYY